MITANQAYILDSCCDGDELFYFLFAEVNFGGQLFPRSVGDGYARYLEDYDWEIATPANEIIQDILLLNGMGFLDCFEVDPDNNQQSKMKGVTARGLELYNDYSYFTFDEHIDKFGYGPHVFYISQAGRDELNKEQYAKYFESERLKPSEVTYKDQE